MCELKGDEESLRFRSWLNLRTASFLFWVVLTIVMVVTMPDLDKLVREKGQITLPDYAQSSVADKILSEMESKGEDVYQFIAVFHSDEPLTEEQKQEIDKVIATLRDKKDELGITNILAYNESEETKKQLASEDGTTVLAQISVSQSQGMVDEVAGKLRNAAETETVDTYFTGTDIVLEDFAKSSQEGIKKTEVIAVVFILVVLVLVFRSPIVPLVSLATVGVSYLVSLSIIAQLVEHFDYPFSTFTQAFLIVILFGIGTDYNILLYTRFKEEVAKGGHILKAIAATYRTAGKTVIFSAVAVFIGFMALYLAEFQLYRAASAVAIGVAVLMLVLVTLNPFFMAVFGFKMFWPAKTVKGHMENRLWKGLSKFSFSHPFAALAIIAVITIPLILANTGELNYNDLEEINDKYESVQAIKVIEKHFPAGLSAPVQLVIQAEKPLKTQEALQDIDKLAEEITKIDGVSEVYSVTRPTGEKIKELYVKEQANLLTDGLGEANSGISEIHKGLSGAEKELGKVDKNQFTSVQALVDGTEEMKKGIGQLSNALLLISQGFEDGAQGGEKLAGALVELKTKLNELSQGASALQSGYNELDSAFSSFSAVFASLSQATQASYDAFSAIEQSLKAAIAANPALNNDGNIMTALEVAKQGKMQVNALLEQLNTITPQYETAVQSLQNANASLGQMADGLKMMESGVGDLQNGAKALAEGLNNGASGATEIHSKTALLENGMAQIHDGQKQLQNGLERLAENMELLQSGLAQSSEGLEQISDGLLEAKDFLTELTSAQDEVFYIPEEVLNGKDFAQSLDMYMSDDYRTTKMMIILDVNPYKKEAMNIMREVDEQINAISKGLTFHDATIVLGGKTAANIDLEDISNGDFMRTLVIMLIGIAIVLLAITKSFWQTIFILACLVLTYLASLGSSLLVSKYALGQEMFGWTVPFFSFIMIITLGVDYSIFLMMRYLEKDDEGYEMIVDASKHIGGVVISAAVILGGTFAALLPSGIITLMQVTIIVIVGLILLSLVMLPGFIPATFGAANKMQNLLRRNKGEK